MSAGEQQALDELSDLGVIIAYAPRLRCWAVWVPDCDVVLLNANKNREQLASAVEELMPEIRRDLDQSLSA